MHGDKRPLTRGANKAFRSPRRYERTIGGKSQDKGMVEDTKSRYAGQ